MGFDININGFLMDNRLVASRTLSGRDGITLHECFNGLESWFEIHTKHDEHFKTVQMLETNDLNTAKKLFIERIKDNGN